MLRWCGAALILCGGLLSRRTLLREQRGAQRTRRELAEAFEAMAAEIRTLLTPLPRLLSQSRGERASAFFGDVSRRFARGAALDEAWCAACAPLALTEEERESVAALGDRLGGDGESVCAALALVAAALRRRYEWTEQSRGETERLVTALCVSVSLFLAVLLL